MGKACPSRLSVFGAMLSAMAKTRGVSKNDLAKAAGISNTATMTRCLQARGITMAYAPPITALVPWADKLQLDDEERRRFLMAGLLARVDDRTARLLWKDIGIGPCPWDHPVSQS
jgi:hypothetical protein